MRYIIIILKILIQLTCFGQQQNDELKLADFKFESIFGYQNADSSNIFCLLGQGFFRTPRSENSDSIIQDWLVKHDNAKIIPVSSFGPTMNDDPNSKMTYCSIVDKNDTLNIYLIKQGCFPGGTMQRPETWDEMKKWEKDLYEDTEKPVVKVFISKRDYKSFIDKIIVAENYAEQNKLGIYNKKNE